MYIYIYTYIHTPSPITILEQFSSPAGQGLSLHPFDRPSSSSISSCRAPLPKTSHVLQRGTRVCWTMECNHWEVSVDWRLMLYNMILQLYIYLYLYLYLFINLYIHTYVILFSNVFNFKWQKFHHPGPPRRATSRAQTVETGKVSWVRRLPSSAWQRWSLLVVGVYGKRRHTRPPIDINIMYIII